ncbi:MAG: hypothetical protein MRJ96_09675 [Nitrospirales bacterium]|nr:hypothetical protein [Nitrospira sp.]MDR4501704.1 hypothetical protein [Nitrospirales bacterium]
MDVIKGDAVPKVHFVSPDVVKKVEDRSIGRKIGNNIVVGMVEGAKSGLKVGVGICATILRSGGANTPEALLLTVLLCGGAMSGAPVLGGMIGGLSAPFVEDMPEESQYQLFVNENIFQLMRANILAIAPENSSKNLCKHGPKRNERWSFEKEEAPIENHLKVNVVEIGFIQEASMQRESYNLLLKLEPVLTDLNNQVLAKQEIEIRHTAHTYEEWAEYDGQLLKTALAQSYRVASQLIVGALILECEGEGERAAIPQS